jgi:hypothetical protein
LQKLADGRVRRRLGHFVSTADVQKCVDALEDPYQRFPGMRGQFISPGIFQHDDAGICFTDGYLQAHTREYLFKPGRSASAPNYLEKLEWFEVTWPGGRGGSDGWGIRVWSQRSLVKLVERRKGRVDGGHWLEPGYLWQDAEGLWYSTKWIAERLCLSHKHVERMRGTLCKRVPLPGGIGTSPWVHHESETRPLLGLPGDSRPSKPAKIPQSGDGRQPKRRDRARPALEKHLRWQEWKSAGLSYNQIVQRHLDETGESVTRDAVVQALRYLAERPPTRAV